MDLPVLDVREQRVLGSLLEKQLTVPASYPLTLNAVRTASNQASSRDPVVDYTESEVDETLRRLKKRDLVRFVWTSGSRTVKYAQALDQVIDLDEGERALLTVLLLRGAQAPGELRTRTERLHVFPDRSSVEQTLRAMAEREPALVRELELRPREQDRRWVHLLGPLPTGEAVPAPAVDREAALAEGPEVRDQAVQRTYDVVAEAYAEQYDDELCHKPFDAWLLDRIAAGADGPVVDVGTGPGHVAARLAAAGAAVTGIDTSFGMVAEARARHPEVTFEVGDLRRLLRPRTAAGWSAITAWYALVHLTESELSGAIGALASTLAHGGALALALHMGPETRHVTELLGHVVDVDFVLHDPDVVLSAVTGAGLEISEWYVRSPLPDIESPTSRLYVLARKP
ncbi:MAG: DUF480 domain-containing protein [Propionibacteriaceae bacterium]